MRGSPAATITATHPDPGWTVQMIAFDTGTTAAAFGIANDSDTGRTTESQDRCTDEDTFTPKAADEPATRVQLLATDGTVAFVDVDVLRRRRRWR